MMRAVVSAPPAGGYGTMTRTGRFGHAACACALPASGAAAIAASIVRRVRSIPGMDRSSSFDGNLAEDSVPVNALTARGSEMLANLSGESAVGLRMQALAICGRHDERHDRIAMSLGDGIDRGGCNPWDWPDPNDPRRSGAGSQCLHTGEQARGEVIVAAGRYDDHPDIARNERDDCRSADADPSGEPTLAKQGAQIGSDRIADEGTCCRRRNSRSEEQKSECRCKEEETHGPKPGGFWQLTPVHVEP